MAIGSASSSLAPTGLNRRQAAVAGWLTTSLLLILGALVVLWGTEYKLSLYKAEATLQMPAKLCTRSSEAAKLDLHLAVRSIEPDSPLLDAAISGFACSGDEDHPQPAAESLQAVLPSDPAELPQVAFRPPPAHAQSAA